MKWAAAEPERELERTLARELRLVRRRSRLPWVYLVYHRRPIASSGSGRLERDESRRPAHRECGHEDTAGEPTVAALRLPSEERRHIER